MATPVEQPGLELAHGEPSAQLPEVHDPAASAPERVLPDASPEVDEKKWPLPGSPPPDPALTPSRPDFKAKDSGDAPESEPPWSPRTNKSENETLKELHLPKESTLVDAAIGNGGGRKHRRRRIFLIAIAVVVLLIAIAVGVGVGVGVTRHNSSSSSSSSTTPAPPSAPTLLPHSILNDSSVAIVALGDGDKRLLYQENSGNIREALYTASTKSWASSVNNIVASNAKNNTPLAALLVNSTGTPFAADTGAVIFLFYIAQDNVLASRQFISGSWTTRDNFSPIGQPNVTFNTETDSRALAVTAAANSTLSGEAYVFYVAQNGSATALSIMPDDTGDGIVASPGPALPDSLQGGKVLALAAGVSTVSGVSRPQVGVLTSNGTVYYNLYFSFFGNSTWTDPELQTILVPPLPPTEQVVYPSSLTLANAYPASTTATLVIPMPTSTTAAYNETLLGDVDIAQIFVNNQKSDSYTLFGFWVNGTDLAAYTTKNIGLSTQPSSPFPFSRLAGTTVGNSSEIYLYHQVNDTSIAEDTYNLDGGFFTTTYFGIATS